MNIAEKTILIVDDTELYRVMLSNLLEDLGINNILIAHNGLEGVRMARYYKPDLVLLDLEMPNIDGYETCEKIRLFADKIAMPVIIITAQEKEGSLEKLFALGANDYFEKPFSAAEIKNRVIFYLEYCETLQKLSTLENNIQSDLDIAKSVQKKTIPSADKMHEQLKEKAELDFYAFCQASIGLGGDLWAVHFLKSGEPVFLLCDISGHGVNAAINSSFIVSTINATFDLCKHLGVNDFNPAEFLDRLNFILSAHIQTGTFCAAACLLYNREEKTISYAGCALPDFQLINLKNGKTTPLPCKGLPMGISPEELTPTSGTINLGSDELLLCMSDGLIESMTADQMKDITKYKDELPGEKALNNAVKALCSSKNRNSSQQFIESIITDFKKNDYILSADDVTILAIQHAERHSKEKSSE